MPRAKRGRIEAGDDPLAAEAAQAAQAAPPRPTEAPSKDKGLYQPRAKPSGPNRRDKAGGLYDPRMKGVVSAAAGTGKAKLGILGKPAPAPTEADEKAAALQRILADLRGTVAGPDGTAAESVASWFGPGRIPTFAQERPPPTAVPEVEPWDAPLLQAPMYAAGARPDATDALVHHPEVVPGPNSVVAPPPAPLQKTPQELRRERHIARVEKQAERRKDERLGIATALPQKLTLRHMATSAQVKHEAVRVGVTAMEQRIRQQMQQRVVDHERRNHEAHHLAIDRQKAHFHATMWRHATARPRIAVWRVVGADSEHLLTKVKINAKQHMLRGAVVWVQRLYAVVVLVGGERAVRQLDRLLRQRIEWPHHTTCGHVWTGLLAPETFEQELFADQAPEDPDTKESKDPKAPESAEAKEKEAKEREARERKRPESVKLLEFDSPILAQGYFASKGIAHCWDAAVTEAL